MLRRQVAIAISAVALMVAPVTHGRIRSATITGTVTDAAGAVIPDAVVAVTQQETDVTTTVKTTAAGVFTAPNLPAGTYTVTISRPGFAVSKQTGISLAVNQTARIDVELKVGAVEQAVEVSAQATQIQTDSSTVQGAVDSQTIAALPNPTDNPLYYVSLQAGVVPRVALSDTTSLNSFGVGAQARKQGSTSGVNGGRAFTNDIQVDGLPVMGGGYNEAAVMPNTEGLQEVRVISNNFSAQYGHGQADYTLRNEALNANNMYNNANGISLLNHTQFAANYDGGLGGDNTASNAASGLKPGMGSSGNTFGTLALSGAGSVLDPCQVVMNLRLRF